MLRFKLTITLLQY